MIHCSGEMANGGLLYLAMLMYDTVEYGRFYAWEQDIAWR